MEEERRKCSDLFDSCFGLVDVAQVEREVCGRLSCEHRLASLGNVLSVDGNVYKDVWDDNVVYRLTWWKIVLIVFVGLWYVGVWWIGGSVDTKGLRRRKGSMQLMGESLKGVLFGKAKRKASGPEKDKVF
jgi:hypothetical protein